jgi:hypothetical protein
MTDVLLWQLVDRSFWTVQLLNGRVGDGNCIMKVLVRAMSLWKHWYWQ